MLLKIIVRLGRVSSRVEGIHNDSSAPQKRNLISMVGGSKQAAQVEQSSMVCGHGCEDGGGCNIRMVVAKLDAAVVAGSAAGFLRTAG